MNAPALGAMLVAVFCVGAAFGALLGWFVWRPDKMQDFIDKVEQDYMDACRAIVNGEGDD